MIIAALIARRRKPILVTQWSDHFTWDEAGIHIAGLTAIGRVTIIALKLNNEIILNARQNWVNAGLHPIDPRP
jgi:hypothetical protein